MIAPTIARALLCSELRANGRLALAASRSGVHPALAGRLRGHAFVLLEEAARLASGDRLSEQLVDAMLDALRDRGASR